MEGASGGRNVVVRCAFPNKIVTYAYSAILKCAQMGSIATFLSWTHLTTGGLQLRRLMGRTRGRGPVRDKGVTTGDVDQLRQR